MKINQTSQAWNNLNTVLSQSVVFFIYLLAQASIEIYFFVSGDADDATINCETSPNPTAITEFRDLITIL